MYRVKLRCEIPVGLASAAMLLKIFAAVRAGALALVHPRRRQPRAIRIRCNGATRPCMTARYRQPCRHSIPSRPTLCGQLQRGTAAVAAHPTPVPATRTCGSQRPGVFAGSYHFGWDSTPAVPSNDGNYSIAIKGNHFGTSGLHWFQPDLIRKPLPAGPYFITQLDANMQVGWQSQNATIDARNPNGYEWCINAPSVDATGVVYVNGEDSYFFHQSGSYIRTYL